MMRRSIGRARVEQQWICVDRPNYRWRIALAWPSGGEFLFGASGVTQILLAEPVLLDRQTLSPAERRRLRTHDRG
jgi:hypothetical protein